MAFHWHIIKRGVIDREEDWNVMQEDLNSL